jgi:hypothetical protein
MNNNISVDDIVKDIATAWDGHKTFALWAVNEFKPTTVVDLGVDYGYSTFIFASPNIGNVYGVDLFEGDIHTGFRNTYDFVNSRKNLYELDNITFIKGLFNDIASQWDKPIDILHIDGLHTYEAVKNDFDTWSKFITNDGIILFHDTVSFADTVGKFFSEIPWPKTNFLHSAGLGVVCRNPAIIERINKVFNLSKKPKIKVFMHLVDLPGSQFIIDEQINSIIDSGLIDHSELFLFCNYEFNNYMWLRDKLKKYSYINYIENSAIKEEFEIPTLMSLKQFCDETAEEYYVLYLHMKGVSRIDDKCMSDWRKLMTYFNIDKWRKCISLLKDGYDTVGVNWLPDHMYPHYSGNYWWAKSSYIKKLPKIKLPREAGFISQFDIKNSLGQPELHKQDAEFWLGMATPNAGCLHKSHQLHYSHEYSLEKYKDTEKISVVIPTTWKFKPFLNFLQNIVELESVGELIIVNKNSQETPDHGVLRNHKVKIYDCPTNTFVKSLWNYAANIAKYEIICMMNDDIIFDTRIFDHENNLLCDNDFLTVSSQWKMTLKNKTIFMKP